MTNENQVNETPVELAPVEGAPQALVLPAEPLALLDTPAAPSNAKVRTSLTLAPDLFDWVRDFAKDNKKSVSAVIGDALDSYRACFLVVPNDPNVEAPVDVLAPLETPATSSDAHE